MGTVIAIVNQKGGTGKTTTCENLGVALAQEGKKVLLVDTDPQSSLTEGFCSSVAEDAKFNLADIMNGIMHERPIDPQEAILHHSQGVDVVISSAELSGVEFDLMNAKNREKVLGLFLSEVKADYDYVLLDCNPSLGILPINSMAAANEVLIPVQSHFADAKGMEHLLRSINRVQLKMNPKLKISGILLTMVEPRTNYAKSVEETIRNAYGAKIKVFESSIPRSIRAAETGGTNLSIFDHDPKGKVAEAYRKLAKEVIESGEKSISVPLSSYDDIFSTEESRAEANQERVQEISLSELHPFEGHPFRVVDDEDMAKTVESVREYGVLTPAIVRPDPYGGYEIISGHRRHHASELAGRDTMPVIVREMDDDAAIILMVDSNLQRESILPSERAFAYRMKMDAIKHQGHTCGQVGHKSRDTISDADSGRQIQRYIRLTELIPQLLDMVDEKKLAFNPAVELSYLTRDEQTEFLEAMDYAQATPSLSQAQRLKKLSQDGECTLDAMCEVMNEIKKGELDRVTLKSDVLRKYFPKSYTNKQMEDKIIQLLEQWQKKRERSQER